MQGTKVDKPPHLLQPGEYTHHKWVTDDGKELSAWYCCTPNGLMGNLGAHNVQENPDGTITVAPSILVGQGMKETWHGYLTNGEWKEC